MEQRAHQLSSDDNLVFVKQSGQGHRLSTPVLCLKLLNLRSIKCSSLTKVATDTG